MRNIDARLRKLEAAMGDKPIAIIWWGEQSEAELQAEIAEREAADIRMNAFSVAFGGKADMPFCTANVCL
jgi:hypothetical protein